MECSKVDIVDGVVDLNYSCHICVSRLPLETVVSRTRFTYDADDNETEHVETATLGSIVGDSDKALAVRDWG